MNIIQLIRTCHDFSATQGLGEGDSPYGGYWAQDPLTFNRHHARQLTLVITKLRGGLRMSRNEPRHWNQSHGIIGYLKVAFLAQFEDNRVRLPIK